MNKLKNRVTMISVVVCILLCSFFIAGCSNNEDNNNTPVHTEHNWSITYIDGGEQHYQTCDGCDEKKYSEHDYTNGNCVCGKENPNSVPTASAKVIDVDGASIDGNKIFMLVDHTVDSVSLADKVVCSSDSVWRLYYDKLGQTEIPTKLAANMRGELLNGNNVFYLVVSSQNGSQTSLYELTVHRSYAVNINFYNMDSLLKTDTAYTGSDYTVSYTPNIEGYIFNNWNRENDSIADDKYTVWGDINFYADKTAKQYTASFDVNGGNELDIDTQTVTYDDNFDFTTPTKTGYSFLGWYDGNLQVTDKNGSSILVWKYDQNKNLTAKWEANTYTLTAVSDNTSGGTTMGGGDYAYDSAVILTAATNSGYTFIGWYNESGDKISSNLEFSIQMEFDVTYTAKWIKVTPVSENTIKGTVSALLDTYFPGDIVTVTATTKAGYTFIGWYYDDIKLTGELNYTFEMPSENMIYTAKWIKVSITVPYTNIGTVSSLSGTYKPGDSATITVVTTNIGYTFIGWYNGDIKLTEELSYTFEMPSVNTTYTAKWKVTDEMKNFVFTSSTTACKITNILDKSVSEIVVPNCVTIIGDNAFSNCSNLSNITIPSSVTFIGNNAFSNCVALTSINVPSSITYIGKYAFSNCSSLLSVTIPNSVKDIDQGTFSGCSSLTSIIIPDSVTSIRYNAFNGCGSLINITIPNSITYIEDMAFYGCDNLRYNEYDNALYLGNNDNQYVVLMKAKDTDITSCQINADTNVIYSYAFYGCSKLTNITIPNNIITIGNSAFRNCNSLTRVTFTKTNWWVRDSTNTWLYSSELENKATAAEYLKSTYSSYMWLVR